jgi:small subunit ribosomal protein S27Ae
MAKIKHYEVKDGKINRKKRTCPRCGEGVFLAEHADRVSCGKCGYTEFKRKEPPKEKKEKPMKEAPSLPEVDETVPSLFEDQK